jgi:hypothetical protein
MPAVVGCCANAGARAVMPANNNEAILNMSNTSRATAYSGFTSNTSPSVAGKGNLLPSTSTM